jgi:septal ring factor EnvC (AmiA/AmiB activator)
VKALRYVRLILCIVFVCSTVSAQKSAKVRELENQRKAALAEIEMTNRLLAETKLSAQNSLNRLNLLTQQILQRRKIINLLTQEVREIDKEIATVRQELSRLESQLGVKRINYGKSIQSLQRKRLGSQDKLLFILSADNFSQSLRRMRYLREYADWQKRQAGEIIGKQQEVSAKRAELEKSRLEKQQLLLARESESRKLENEEAGQKREIDELNKKQKQLQADLKKKQRQADALNRQIEKQIAEEVAWADAEARAAGKKKPDDKTDPSSSSARTAESRGGYAMTREEKKLSDSFAGNRGRLPFPVSGQYSIVGTYGEQQHPELKYVRTQNNGIDILTTAGAEARAVFEGEVTSLFVVGGYNNSVIVRHGNYLTVYANLSEVFVKKGDKVTTRQSIGKIYTDEEADNSTILHFELRKEKVKQNPLVWLAR